MKYFLGTLCALLLLINSARAYGPLGHETVGAIADERLAKTPTAAKIAALTDGISLERASTIPDEIKSWDKNGPDDPHGSHFKDHPKIDLQLREFWKANPPTQDKTSATPSHHWFHYADVPLFDGEKYSSSKLGRNQWDIVHMIPYCAAVLKGEVSEDNPRKITKAVAIILLAHYLGDIHQPLHVGAEYFDNDGHPLAVKGTGEALEDQGGNSLSFVEIAGPKPGYHHSLHGYWDNDVVKSQFSAAPEDLPKDEMKTRLQGEKAALVQQLAAHEPRNWRLPTNVAVKDWAQAWADEIMPIAREAHRRLQFEHVRGEQDETGAVLAKGVAKERHMPDGVSYHDWSARIVRDELHRAGWRLADLMEKCVSSGGAETVPAPPTSAIAPVPSASANATVVPAARPHLTSAARSMYGPVPENYKEIITSWLKSQGKDPAGLAIQWQTEPRPADLPDETGQKLYGYLVIFNTTEKGGVPPSAKTRSVLIRDGAVVKSR